MRARPRRWTIVAGLLAGAVVAVLALVVIVLMPLARAFGSGSWWRVGVGLLRPADVLPRDADGRTNVLLLGLGTPVLTDTILLVSLDVAQRGALLLSVPRDLAVALPEGLHRINEAYHRATVRGGDGAEEARRVVGEVLGIDIQRVASIGIDGLSQIVDDMRGVPIEVDRAYTDELMPDSAFDAGWQWLHGARALNYARTRHGGAFEGSDFSRIRRQQKVLLALEYRFFSPTVLLNPVALHDLARDIAANVSTDLRLDEIVALVRVLSGLDRQRITRVSLSDEGLVVEMRGEGGAYLLAPVGGDLGAIHRRVRALRGGAAPLDEGILPIVAREDWDPLPPRYDGPKQKVRRILIHHDCVHYPDHLAPIEQVRLLLNSVRDDHGWLDLPYHFVVASDGSIFAGRDESWPGETATLYDTADTLQIAILGDHRRGAPTAAQREALLHLVERKRADYGLGADDVHLHSDVAATSCPGAATRDSLEGLWSRSCAADQPLCRVPAMD